MRSNKHIRRHYCGIESEIICKFETEIKLKARSNNGAMCTLNEESASDS